MRARLPACLVALLVLSGLAASAQGASTTTGTLVITCECSSGVSEVDAIRPDGHGERFLFNAVGTVRWSPSGTALAFAAFGAIWTYSVARASYRRLTSPPGNRDVAGDSDPAWFPGGKRLVFVRARQMPPSGDNITSLQTIAVDGGRAAKPIFETPKATAPVNVGFPDVDRAGRRIAFSDNAGHLWTTNSYGLGRHLLDTANPNGYYPRWSPDGTRVAFLEGGQQPAILDVRTGHIRELTVGEDPYSTTALSWSPDGRRLAVSYDHPYDCGDPTGDCYVGRLWIVDLQSGSSRKIYTTPENGGISSIDWTAATVSSHR